MLTDYNCVIKRVIRFITSRAQASPLNDNRCSIAKSGFYFPRRDAVCLRCPFITAGFKILSKTAWHLEMRRPGIPLWSLLTTVLFTLSLVLLTQYPYHIRGITQPLSFPFAACFGFKFRISSLYRKKKKRWGEAKKKKKKRALCLLHPSPPQLPKPTH